MESEEIRSDSIPSDEASAMLDAADPPLRPMSVSLLRRLAEAAHGYRDGKTVLFTAARSYTPHTRHRLRGPFQHDAEARTDSVTVGRMDANEYGIFGPYETAKRGNGDPKRWRVAKVTLLLENTENPAETIPHVLDGNKHDAVFWSEAAVDKFLVPYYTTVGSLEEGRTVKEAMEHRDTIALTHLPGSDWVDVRPNQPPAPAPDGELGLYSLVRRGEKGAESVEMVPVL